MQSEIPASQEGEPIPSWQRFDQFLSYYLDCIREDDSQGARLFLTDEGSKFLPLPLAAEWCLSDQGVLRVPVSRERGSFLGQLRQRGRAGALFYGYPLYVDWIKQSGSGWTGGFAVPVFLQSIEHDIEHDALDLDLVHEWPRTNPDFLRSVFHYPEERKSFLHDLGLLEEEGAPPEDGLAGIVRRMSQIELPGEVAEPLDPENLQREPPIAEISGGGYYNRAILVVGEQSRYTRGLERELEYLRDNVPESKLEKSSLSLFFGQQAANKRSADVDTADLSIAEVVPLNDEQREAVRSAFGRSLTVVTGPPGTGKSQVVLSVLANAYLKGMRVLFASRNHKAIDVVEERINRLSDHPIVLRLGSRSRERDLRAELLTFLSQVLSSSASDEDRLDEKEAREALSSLMQKREDLWARLEQVRLARNEVDHFDRRLEAAKDKLPEASWRWLAQTQDLPPRKVAEGALKIIRRYLQKHVGLIETIRRWLHRNKEYARASRLIDELSSGFSELMEPREDLVTEETLEYWQTWLAAALELIEAGHLLDVYKQARTELSGMPTSADFANELAGLEERIWEWGARWIAATGRLLPDKLTPDVRRALGQYRATIEQLAKDQIGGKAAYARLRRDQERVFAKVAKVLPVWFVANLSARGWLPFDSGLFDLVVIDEASQCDFPSALPLLYRARRAMIIGDPHQLRHIVSIPSQRLQQIQNRHELTRTEDGPYLFSNSLYDVASTCAGEGKVISLREHFRSHADIVEYSNRMWYGGMLRICTDYRRLAKPLGQTTSIEWTAAQGTVRRARGGGDYNREEAEQVVRELEALLVQRRFAGTVGVVTPFRAQANRIRELANQRLDLHFIEASELTVDTAYGFQGDERDVMFFSPCVSREMPRGAKWFHSVFSNLFNVSVTRARALLHVVGDPGACASCGIKHIEEFARYFERLKHGRGFVPHRKIFDDPSVGPFEEPLYKALVEAGLKPIPQYQEHQYRLDLALPECNPPLDIEVDGELFHKEWDGTRCRQDVIRDLRLTALGWLVKRFWVYQVRDNMASCVREILELCKQA